MHLMTASMLMVAVACSARTTAAPLSWTEVHKRAPPAPGLQLPYGAARQQFGELRLPAGAGPHPVVVLLHGGCWLNAFDYRYMTHLADRLTQTLGLASWTPEFRRVGDSGGGWPGTLLDVADATDHLRVLEPEYRLDLTRVVTMGHSSGGHLALWVAARARLKADSDLFRPDPLPIRGAVGLAAIADLIAYGQQPGGCNSAVEQLLDGTPLTRHERYQESSPRQLLPLGVPQWLVHGEQDDIVSALSARAYADAALAAGDTLQLRVLPAAGHFDPALPEPVSWGAIEAAVREAVD